VIASACVGYNITIMNCVVLRWNCGCANLDLRWYALPGSALVHLWVPIWLLGLILHSYCLSNVDISPIVNLLVSVNMNMSVAKITVDSWTIADFALLSFAFTADAANNNNDDNYQDNSAYNSSGNDGCEVLSVCVIFYALCIAGDAFLGVSVSIITICVRVTISSRDVVSAAVCSWQVNCSVASVAAVTITITTGVTTAATAAASTATATTSQLTLLSFRGVKVILFHYKSCVLVFIVVSNAKNCDRDSKL